MPKIERSVEYTFAAYAGVKESEAEVLFKAANAKREAKREMADNLMCLEESTDVDDISKFSFFYLFEMCICKLYVYVYTY